MKNFGKKFSITFLVIALFFGFAGQAWAVSGWTQIPETGEKGWTGIASSSDGVKLVAVAIDGVYTSNDSGATWTSRSVSGLSSGRSVASSSDGVKLVIGDGNNGYIYTSTDSGATWTERTGAGTGFWYSVSSSSDGTKLIALAS